MKLMVPAIKPAGPANAATGHVRAHLELLGAIDALLDESLAAAPSREEERLRRACMAAHPTAGHSAATLSAAPASAGPNPPAAA